MVVLQNQREKPCSGLARKTDGEGMPRSGAVTLKVGR